MADFSDYRIFNAVVQHGSMVRAARSLGLSPASVSKSISRMEDHYDTRLFHRTTRHIRLTENGNAFLLRVQRVLSLMDEAEDFIREQRGALSGLVKLCAPAVFAGRHIIPHLNKFSKSYPDLKLDIQLSDTPVNPVTNGCDVAFCIGTTDAPGLETEHLATSHKVICGTPEYLKKFGYPESTRDLKNHNCITSRDNTVWHLTGPDGIKKISVQGNIKSQSGEVLRESVLSGLGLGLLSPWLMADEMRKGALNIVLPELKAAKEDNVTAVYAKHEYLPAKVKTLVDFFKNVYSGKSYWTTQLRLN